MSVNNFKPLDSKGKFSLTPRVQGLGSSKKFNNSEQSN